MPTNHFDPLPASKTISIGWVREAGRRLLVWWPVKMAGMVTGMAAFFLAYFWVLRYPLHAVTVMPLTVVDRWIGLQPAALPLYISLWVYVSLAPALIIDRRELVACGLAWVTLSLIGLAVFLCWPTAVPAPDIDWSLYPSLVFLKSADAAGNACPSLHVAFAVLSACWLGGLLRRLGAGRAIRIFNGLWCVGILYSTIATRQHVFLDVLAGAALGAGVAVASQRWWNPRGVT
jgi:membrane-associated phospholipid phosphatase